MRNSGIRFSQLSPVNGSPYVCERATEALSNPIIATNGPLNGRYLRATGRTTRSGEAKYPQPRISKISLSWVGQVTFLLGI